MSLDKVESTDRDIMSEMSTPAGRCESSHSDVERARTRGQPVERQAYVVCATPRSGSTLLCELLKSTGVAGAPEEYFEARADTGLPPHPGDYLDGLPRTGAGVRDDTSPPEPSPYSDLRGIEGYREHLERSFRLGATPNGVFGTKLMWRSLGQRVSSRRSCPSTPTLISMSFSTVCSGIRATCG
jgi:hypothetical protein